MTMFHTWENKFSASIHGPGPWSLDGVLLIEIMLDFRHVSNYRFMKTILHKSGLITHYNIKSCNFFILMVLTSQFLHIVHT